MSTSICWELCDQHYQVARILQERNKTYLKTNKTYSFFLIISIFIRRVALAVLILIYTCLQVMKRFPESLQYEIHLHTHFTVISNSFLFQTSEPGCRRGIAMRMLRQHHLPGHRIVFHGDEVDSLYLVRRGKIDILVDNIVKEKIGEYLRLAIN